jgi:hypothetical protein
MQIDFDAHEFAPTGSWKDPRENVRYGLQVLSDFKEIIARNTDLRNGNLVQAAIASYNCGPGNVLTAISTQKDIDYFTAGQNYSKDILNRAEWFQLHGWG